MPDFPGRAALAFALLALTLPPAHALAAGALDGLEMDVMVGGESPADAVNRIAIPLEFDALDTPGSRATDDQKTPPDGAGQDAVSGDHQRMDGPGPLPVEAR
jgi:hypothetical protein